MTSVDITLPDGTLLCRAQVADSFGTRGRGLLGRRGLAPDEGLLIQPCTSVHTWFMRFPIDVLYLDDDNRVVKTAKMPAFRMSLGGKGAKKVVELPAGAIETKAVQVGDRLSIEPVSA